MREGNCIVTAAVIVVVIAAANLAACRDTSAILNQMPEYDPGTDVDNHDWFNEEPIAILDYSGDAMEIGISPDGEYLLFNDRNKPNKDMHWSTRIDDRTYQYRGKVSNTVSDKVDGTPAFDGHGSVYFTTLKTLPRSFRTIYTAGFKDGVALDPVPLEGNIYLENRRRQVGFWISLDPDVSDDGTLLFYSEGLFNPRTEIPYPYNVRGAEKVNGEFVRMDDRIFENINTDSLEYAPAISSDGREIFFSRIGKIDGRPKMVGIFTACRASTTEPFSRPERIAAITGNVEAPVLSGDETRLYYHRMVRGVFKAYRVTRKSGKRTCSPARNETQTLD